MQCSVCPTNYKLGVKPCRYRRTVIVYIDASSLVAVVGRKDGIPHGKRARGESILTSPVCGGGIIAGLVGGVVLSNGGNMTRGVICNTFTEVRRGTNGPTLRIFRRTVGGVVPLLRMGTEHVNNTACRIPVRMETSEHRTLTLH